MASKALTVGGELGYSPTIIQLVKDLVAKDTTDEELALFLYTAKRAGLDPLARQIYCIKRWDSKLRREVAAPQVSIDGYRLIADRTGRYAPGRAPTYEERGGKLFSATAYVMKYVLGQWHEVSATAFWDEYAQYTKDGNLTAMWARMPRLLLGKCSEALALRKAFPAELSGIYTTEEMGTELPAPTPPANGKAPIVGAGPDWDVVEVEGAIDADTGEILDAQPALRPTQTERPAPGSGRHVPKNAPELMEMAKAAGADYGGNTYHLQNAIAVQLRTWGEMAEGEKVSWNKAMRDPQVMLRYLEAAIAHKKLPAADAPSAAA